MYYMDINQNSSTKMMSVVRIEIMHSTGTGIEGCLLGELWKRKLTIFTPKPIPVIKTMYNRCRNTPK